MKSFPNVIPAKAGIYVIFTFLFCVLLFWKFFFRGLIPLPADTIVGMYHPWRDFYAKEYPNGIPFNNPLITDPVRQQFIWKKLVIDSYKKGEMPINNPYSFSGYPLLANFQSGVFYPLNIIFFIFPFNIAWGIYIFLQFFLGGVFMYLFLHNILCHCEERSDEAILSSFTAFLGSIVWILSGFWISWAEWGNILHTALWLPLILLSIDKIKLSTSEVARQRPRLLGGGFTWFSVYLFSLCFSFFAGHLQTFFYLFIFSHFYLFYKTYKSKKSHFWYFIILDLFFFTLSSIQWYPTLQFILQSARNVDINDVLIREDWFIPVKQLIQLFIPDYFGNPAKGNYWGAWNYGEFLSYIGIIPIFIAMSGIFYSIKKRRNIFWLIMLGLILLFSLKNPISEIPYYLQIPFFSTAQPSRLIFLLDFLLIIFFCKSLMSFRRRPESILFLLFLLTLSLSAFFQFEHQQIIFRNSIQPIVIFLLFVISTEIINFINVGNGRDRSLRKTYLFFGIIFLLTFFDLSRIFLRYNTFTHQKYIFPETKIIKFLKDKSQTEFFRIASLNREIMPPNFAVYYQIHDIGGYDPLYYEKYAKLFSGDKQINLNRILQLDYADEKIFNKLNVKYVLTFDNLPVGLYRLILTEGKTKLYEY